MRNLIIFNARYINLPRGIIMAELKCRNILPLNKKKKKRLPSYRGNVKKKTNVNNEEKCVNTAQKKN